MRIEASNIRYRGVKLTLCDGIQVAFNNKGVAEIPDEQGQKVLDEYKGMFYEEGKAPIKRNDNKKSKTSDEYYEIENLKNALHIETEKLKKSDASLILEKKSCKSWKDQYEKTAKELESLKKNTSKVDSKEIDSKLKEFELQIKTWELKYNLIQQSVKELKDAAVATGCKAEEVKNLEKDKIVDLIIERSNAKD